MERVFRSLKTEWIPTTGYMNGQQAQRDISQYLMHHYNWIRPHQFNDGLAPAKTEETLTPCPGSVDPLQSDQKSSKKKPQSEDQGYFLVQSAGTKSLYQNPYNLLSYKDFLIMAEI